MWRIKRNAIKCNHCGEIIESTYRHDFKTCSCGRVSVDGGHDYLRRCFVERGDYMDLSETEEIAGDPEGLSELQRNTINALALMKGQGVIPIISRKIYMFML